MAYCICIPNVFVNISEARIRNVFDTLAIFTILRIDMAKNFRDNKFQRVFIHIKDWAISADAVKAKDMLLSGKELKIVYNDPWFWKVTLSKEKKPNKAVRIDFSDEPLHKTAPEVKEDNRPYSLRRIDPVYCEQDIKQGFRDRRLPISLAKTMFKKVPETQEQKEKRRRADRLLAAASISPEIICPKRF